MATTTYAYPFDPTGTLAGNKITGEQQVITPANYRDFHFVVPTFAPFFSDGAVIKFRGADNVVRTLVEGVDFLFTHWFIAASRACAKPIYGSISFLDLTLSGTVILDYQTLGGMWTQDTATIAAVAADLIHNPRITAWDVVVNQPVTFPVIDHQWDLVDLVGASDLVAALQTIETALRQTGATGLADHLVDYNNPHHVTAAEVGLGNVQNYGTADAAATIDGSSAALYVTPFGLMSALNVGPNAAINAHVARNDNPHAVTANQVGAYTQAQTNALLAAKLSTTGVAYDTSRFDGKTATEYRDWALSTGVAANSLQFNGMTPGEFQAYVLTGQAADSAKFNGKTYAQVMTDVQNSTVAATLSFGGLDPAAYKADVLTGTAANAAEFAGMTQAQWESYLGTKFGSAGSVAAQLSQPGVGGQAVGSYWYEIGRAYFPGASPMASQQDAHWLVAGGDAANGRFSALRYLHLSTRGASGDGVTHALYNFDGTPTQDQIGYTVEMLDNGSGTMVSTVRVWVKTQENHGRITVTNLAQGNSTLLGGSTAVTVEPASITYFAEDISGLASKASVDQLRTDVTSALDSLTQAFNDLATQVAAS